jgi:hypothetical protein
VKSVVKDALQALVKDEIDDMAGENMMMEDELTATDIVPKSDPKTVTGSLDETIRSNEYLELKLLGAWATSDSSRAYTFDT